MVKQYGLIGYPLGHSISPVIHKRLFELSGNFDADYKLIEISPDKINDFLPKIFKLDGFNVTIPYKVFIYKYLKILDDTAKKYGSLNTVCKLPNKDFKGYNTDAYGFLKSISLMGVDLKCNVLLLGCGGAGRMMAVETASNGGRLTVAVRSSSQKKALSLKYEIQDRYKGSEVEVADINNIPKKNYDLIINSTPSGMYPNVNDIPVNPVVCSYAPYLFDAVYNPKDTVLMKTARSYGAKVLGGMSMLVWQAVAAHKIWNDAGYKNETIKILIENMYNELT